MAIDCAVGDSAPGCVSGFDPTVSGGYVYGDFPNIVGGPEVHGSGEIWGQTLWDLRTALGHKVADNLITRAMTLSAEDPDYLDMRNAVLRADLVAYGGRFADTIWQVFAHRGMGFFAGSIDAADGNPASDFHVPPPAGTPHNGVVSGTVTDSVTGDPVAGAVVQVTGQGDQYSTTTNAQGRYAIGGLVVGTYAKVAASAPGYFGAAQPGDAVSGQPTFGTNFSIVHDWAAISGGAAVADFNGPDFSAFGCGPTGAFDTSLTTGWGSTTGDDNGTPTNQFIDKFIVVRLPRPVDISSFEIDPSATCGDGLSASTSEVTISVSTDGNGFTDVFDNIGTGFTNADDGHLNPATPTGATDGVQFVKLTIHSNQTPDFNTNCPDGAFSGCAFTDLTELVVLGSPSP
jgi:hypothetical protein